MACPLSIGLTGNIGAGKTTVAREFERLGVAVYYADRRAKELMHSDRELVAAIRRQFGDGVYSQEGELLRDRLAARVFGNEAELDKLSALVHPAVARDAASWQNRQTGAYTLHEAAIIFEIGNESAYDAILVVTADEDVRARRVMERDRSSREQFEARAARQWSERRKSAAADYLIRNSGRHLLLPQVLAIDRELRGRAAHLSPA